MMIIAVKVRQHTNYYPSISVLAILAMESFHLLLEMRIRPHIVEERETLREFSRQYERVHMNSPVY